MDCNLSCEPCMAAVEPSPGLGVLAVPWGPKLSRPVRSVDADVDSGVSPGVGAGETGTPVVSDGVTDQSDET